MCLVEMTQPRRQYKRLLKVNYFGQNDVKKKGVIKN